VIGNSLAALMCGYQEGVPVLMLGPSEPLFFETFDPKSNLEFVGFENKTRLITTPAGEIEVGLEKYKVYRKLSLMMSMAGLLPLSDKAVSMRLVDDDTIKVVLDHARSVKFKFENIMIFQNDLLEPKSPPKYMVLDWMNVRSGMIHPFDRIESTSDFVSCIHFYPSKRIDGNHPEKKDLVSVSYLTREQLDSYEFSDTYARFEIIDKMKKAGIRGARNGRDSNNPEKYKHYAVRIETEKRQTIPIRPNVSYMPSSPTDNNYLRYLSSVA
jgi:hypothetical protein